MGRMSLLEKTINNQPNMVEGFCLVKSASEKVNSKGNAYLDLILSDAGGEINAKLWDYDKTMHSYIKAGEVIKIRGEITLWRETEQLKVIRVRPYDAEKDDVDMNSLIPSSPFDTKWMYEELVKVANEFENADLTKLVLFMLEERKELLLNWPAALKLHHAFSGGLLYHTFSMIKLAKGVCEVYPALNSDLVYGGIILHDLAKMDELIVGDVGIATGYSVRGQLLGHIAMGVANIETTCQKLGIDDNIKTLMQHIILSHHSNPDFGSPKPPMFPEAEVVAAVDMLDARMYEMFDVLESVEKGGFSERQWSMDNRMLYKHD